MINEEVRAQVIQAFSALKAPVKVILFTQQNACPTCTHQHSILKEIASLSPLINLETHDLLLDNELASRLKVDKIPATIIMGKSDQWIRFYGVTAGYEFTSLLEAIMMASTGKSDLDPDLEDAVKAVSEEVHLQIFVTPTCPYCPKLVKIANQFAFINSKIKSEVVEAAEFPQLALRYQVTGVPKTVINERFSFEGALPAPSVYLQILKAVNPEEYRKVDEALRELKGERKARLADEEATYDVAIIGGGPAGLSAVIYAARKGLLAVLISKAIGGQLGYTAEVENYLGIRRIGGAELIEAFRNHAEAFTIHEAIGSAVVKIEREKDRFAVVTETGKRFRALSVIYCAGKEYRRLGVPGEDRFIGKGIAFCATCDAPLYRGKRVAVIGGANSAFTAARDLIPFASEVHLIHRKQEFKADQLLIDEVLSSAKVKVHSPMEVQSFLGNEKLIGVRLREVGKGDGYDLAVDGVFLEIGLTPNSAPIKGLANLNEAGEVVVDRFQSVGVPGMFAAGDVTDVKDKQIIVAAGQGAQAALSAHRYLLESGLKQSRALAKDEWE